MNTKDITTNIIFAAESLWDVFLRTHAHELGERKGGVLQILPLPMDGSSSVEELLSSIREISFGRLSEEKKQEKSEFARRKIAFLLTQYTDAKGYTGNYDGPICSLEAEDEANGMYGGGIITDTHIIAFSGFPPDIDQKFVILAAETANNISKTKIIDIWFHSATNENKWIARRALAESIT